MCVSPPVEVTFAPPPPPADAPCSNLQGLLSGLLPDAQISASSSRDMVWNPGTARLVASRSGWFPAPAHPLAGEEWLQVDLGVPKGVRGIITQGARGGDAGSGATADNRAFVRKYKVAYSLNGKEWNFIMDHKISLPKVGTSCLYITPPLRLSACTHLTCRLCIPGFRGEHSLRHPGAPPLRGDGGAVRPALPGEVVPRRDRDEGGDPGL